MKPDEREARYGDPLNAELRLANVGEVSGGGSLLSDEDEMGRRSIIFSGIDVDAYDLDAARTILRDHLPHLGCVAGTRLEFEDNGSWEDVFVGPGWIERQPMTPYSERDDDGRP
ncbi:hypothetical protein [uncultured Sphingomonas sp.]|uniref:hypothetical protein n=1 Tax=uncultured Sphingomonas sp. TaxID=158754 RepID=UPI0035C97BF4